MSHGFGRFANQWKTSEIASQDLLFAVTTAPDFVVHFVMLPFHQVKAGLNQAEQMFVFLEKEAPPGDLLEGFFGVTLRIKFEDFAPPDPECRPPLNQQSSGRFRVLSGEEFAKQLVTEVSDISEVGLQRVIVRRLKFKDIDLSRVAVDGYWSDSSFHIDIPAPGSEPERKKTKTQHTPKNDLCGDLLAEDWAEKRGTHAPSRDSRKSAGGRQAKAAEGMALAAGAQVADDEPDGLLKELGLSSIDVSVPEFVAASSAVGGASGFAGLHADLAAIIAEDLSRAGCLAVDEQLGSLGAGEAGEEDEGLDEGSASEQDDAAVGSEVVLVYLR